jgi:hypothetical protein
MTQCHVQLCSQPCPLLPQLSPLASALLLCAYSTTDCHPSISWYFNRYRLRHPQYCHKSPWCLDRLLDLTSHGFREPYVVFIPPAPLPSLSQLLLDFTLVLYSKLTIFQKVQVHAISNTDPSNDTNIPISSRLWTAEIRRISL